METEIQKQPQKNIILVLLIVNIVVFCLFLIPNTAGCDDFDMVRIFEPDEGIPISVLYHMLGGGENAKDTLLRFLSYDYYHYGFPYFGYSAILLLVLKWSGQYTSAAVIFPVLRQLVSVLPMLLAITGLTYFWTGFKKWLPTFLLYFSLLTVPAVVGNMLWWHPDGLQFLFVVLVMVSLKLDDWKFKRFFLLAGLLCGFSIGIKLQGLFFFLTIPTYLLVGVLQKNIKWPQAIIKAILFVVLMLVGLWVSNPLLIFGGMRATYWDTLQKQAQNSQLGYGIFYPKGFGILIQLVRDYYGGVWLYVLAFLGCVLGLFSRNKRLSNLILLTWFLPQFVYLLTSVALKYQYLLGAFIPLLVACMNWLEPEELFPSFCAKISAKSRKFSHKVIRWAVIILLVLFSLLNILTDVQLVSKNITRRDTSEAIQFYEGIPESIFDRFSAEEKIYIDYRVYFPKQQSWQIFWSYEMLDYSYVREQSPDYMILMTQRMHDYTNQNNMENAIDPVQMENSAAFYTDALNNEVQGYQLIFEHPFAKIFEKIE